MATMNEVISVRLSPELAAVLREQAREDGRLPGNMARRLLTQSLEQLAGKRAEVSQ